MDSKRKNTAAVIIILLMLTTIGAVLLTNADKIPALGGAQNGQTAGVQGKASDGSDTEMPKERDLSAFMRDDTFFDDAPKKTEREKEEELAEEVSMSITSVEKDIRIHVVDGMGRLLQGQELYVLLDNGEEFKDLDKDGVIYIPDLKAGDYYVTLGALADYSVPAAGTKVRVKDKVTYTEIKDISLLIKTEADIDAGKEDTGVKDALSDADDTEIRIIQLSDGKAKFGIDVSKWNKEIDWQKVADSGVEYAIIRAGYRGSASGALVEDPYFRKNIEGAEKANIKVGLYFFTQAVSEVEAVEEASMVLSLCADYKITYPIFIDTEGAGGYGRADTLDRQTRTAVCEAFCETIRSAGYDAGVYASKNWFNNNPDAARMESYAVWLAEYKAKPTYNGTYQMWQYTSKGAVNGIDGRVDLNMSYLGY